MNPLFESRRYLISVDSRRLSHHFTDCLVIGSGVAGLRAALEAASFGQVMLVTKSEPSESATFYAQGGIAAVLDRDDSVESHVADTLTAGGGLCDRNVVEMVVREGPEQIRELIKLGATFDRVDGELIYGREGGHSASRIVHARGDATGQEIARTLLEAAGRHEGIQVLDSTFVLDVITDDAGRCRGAVIWQPEHGPSIVWAGATILASGGAGQLYRESTNPAVATADGHALAWRAGATIADIEMMQFHPTTLYVAGAARALITEAVRGEGATLLDRNYERFMPDIHELAELAPRDVVSQAIVERMEQTRTPYVYLDCRHIGRERFAQRFPTIFQLLESFDLDVGSTPIPVRPAAHYMVGGVVVDLDGRTSVPGLLAAGEVTCSGLHGANRLASNSLLEGLVYGARSGRAAAELMDRGESVSRIKAVVEPSERTPLDLSDVRNSLRSLMGRNLGVERDGERLAESAEIIDFWARYVMDKTFADPAGWELQNLLTVSSLMNRAATVRTESRGVHSRRDFPDMNDTDWRCHLQWTRGRDYNRRQVQGQAQIRGAAPTPLND